MLPQEEADLEQFVKIMREVFKDRPKLHAREEFVSELVDLFYRIDSLNRMAIRFEHLTTYLIDHEIAFDAEQASTGNQGASNSSSLNMEYEEVPLKNPRPHNNYIEKIHFFPQIDKIVLFEQNYHMLRIYAGATMRFEKELECPRPILAVEFIISRNSICVSLSDRTFFFFEVSQNQSTPYKPGPIFHLPSTQNCLCYVPR